jgi:adenylylsulfate kinase
MLIAMAGLPGTGKSTLAWRLAGELSALVLDKDAVRAALFPPSEIEYSTAQDDLCVELMLRVAGHVLGKDSRRHVILDGRTFSRRYQVDVVRAAARRLGVACAFVECICPEEVVRQRLARDVTEGLHPAKNRTYEMYLSVRSQAEPITGPKLVVNTEWGAESVLQSCLEYVRSLSAS